MRAVAVFRALQHVQLQTDHPRRGRRARARRPSPVHLSGTLITTIDRNNKFWCFFAANPVALRRLCEGRAPWQLFGESGFDSRQWQSCFFLPEAGVRGMSACALKHTVNLRTAEFLPCVHSLTSESAWHDEGALAATAVRFCQLVHSVQWHRRGTSRNYSCSTAVKRDRLVDRGATTVRQGGNLT